MPEQPLWYWWVAAFAVRSARLGLTALLTSKSAAGAGADDGAQRLALQPRRGDGRRRRRVLLARGGFDALAIGLPLFGLVSAACVAVAPRR